MFNVGIGKVLNVSCSGMVPLVDIRKLIQSFRSHCMEFLWWLTVNHGIPLTGVKRKWAIFHRSFGSWLYFFFRQ